VMGNQTTVAALKNMLEQKTLPHTILFSGPSGCGKTTLARILAGTLGCDSLDLRELNCSDFRGIDTIRDIARTMNLAAANESRVWILDEVHQLSKDGQNAALKMLEDTPDHVYFFLCTTDPQKLIKTIQNRCCGMPVSLLTYEELTALVDRVLTKEEKKISDDIKDEIVASAQGSARMVLVLLDKILNLKEADQKKAIADKLAQENEAIELCRALLSFGKGGVGTPSWKRISDILKNLKGEPESIRYAVLGYSRAVLLNGQQAKQAAHVIDCFERNFFDSKEAGLALACYNVLFTE